MNSRRAHVALFGVALISLVACAPMGGPGGRGGPGEMGGRPGDDAMAGQAEPRTVSLASMHGELLARVGADLVIADPQRAAWDDYCDAVGALMTDQMRGTRVVATSDDAVRQIGRKVDVVRNRLAAMEEIQAAAERLYTVLTPEQRRIADVRLAATVPALYSGLSDDGNSRGGRGQSNDRRGPPSGGPGGGGMGI